MMRNVLKKGMKAVMVIGLAIPMLLLTGCTTRYLIFTTYTKVGLDISVADGTPTSASFAFKRFQGAVIPVDVRNNLDKEPDPETNAGGPKTMSLFGGIHVKNGWMSGLKIKQVFATGAAAVEYAKTLAEDGGDDDNGGDDE